VAVFLDVMPCSVVETDYMLGVLFDEGSKHL
jgi:hypothetical protein